MSFPIGASPSTRVINSFSSRVTSVHLPRAGDQGAASTNQDRFHRSSSNTIFRQVTKINRIESNGRKYDPHCAVGPLTSLTS